MIASAESAAACEALESAVSESRAVGYVWMERKALEDMLAWVEGDEAGTRRVRERIGAMPAFAARKQTDAGDAAAFDALYAESVPPIFVC